jgi:hypothetical protein
MMLAAAGDLDQFKNLLSKSGTRHRDCAISGSKVGWTFRRGELVQLGNRHLNSKISTRFPSLKNLRPCWICAVWGRNTASMLLGIDVTDIIKGGFAEVKL